MILNFLQIFFEDSLILNLFRYITFRALLAAVLSFLMVLLFMPKLMRWLQNLRVGQVVRDDGPQTHLKKKGTPTMGGVLIVGAIFVVCLLFNRLDNLLVWIVLGVLILSGFVGFLDDFLKLRKKNSKGVSFRLKMLSLSAIALGAVWLGLEWGLIESRIHFPFFKEAYLDVGFLYYLWSLAVIVGSSNAVNLTDGLDGLAIVPVMTTALVLAVIAYVSGHALFSNYLQFQFMPGAGELSIVMTAMIGAGLGFLWYNAHPAQVFMGDVGSLSLGAALGVSALLIHQELVLFIAGFLFVMEAVSVMIQVGWYKSSKKRIFRMAPLHHHFELSGWPESKVIVRFWILSILFAVIALTTLKLR
ncbi:MAG: phospho-N-acetylmuramoyl-pentapeptide-transferase [Bradymonadales bacterium]|nr:MAG: phospho-N-acetylmuramoyl-pentapeptide-transferase [Bradymonadales bacterium]